MNAQMEEKLRLACLDAADVFELDPKSFLMGTYAMKDGYLVRAPSRGYVVTDGDSFCALGAVSYLSGYTLGSCADFLIPAIRELSPRMPDLQPEEYNNGKGRVAVIQLLRHAAIRTTSTSEAAAK